MDYLHWQLDALERIISGEKKPDSLDLQLLRQLTGNFSDDRRIGEGGCGEIYKGILPNGVAIAVKKIKSSHTIDEKMFLREVDSMINVGHQNIVRFLGYCSETKGKAHQMDGITVMAEERERLLCFEYIRRGSIDKYLTDELRGFEWRTRYQIIKGICYGLLHLHKDKRILHMDLKPANILLSDQMVPKITDFGLSRIDGISQTTSEQRLLSRNYCAPEYIENGKRSLKSDIYSLGVIMIELVTGSRQQVPNITKVLRRWRHRWSKSSKHIPIWYQQVKTCLELAVSCKEKNPINRPFIWDVVCKLKKLDSRDSQIIESSIEKIISSSDDMLGIEPLELDFTLAHHKKQISCSIELTNDTDYDMAFRIASTGLSPFSIQPAKGIAAPRSKCTTSITLSTQEMTPLHSYVKEGFIVQSTRIDGSVAAADITDDMFNDEWGNSQKKVDDGDKVVDEVNLTVLFDKKLHEKHQKDVANLSAEMRSLGTSAQVRLFLSEDSHSPSQAGLRPQDNLQAKGSWLMHAAGPSSDDSLPPGLESLQPTSDLKIDISQIPLIRWRRPPQILYDHDWLVVAGEESEEVALQNERMFGALEAIYPRPSNIPPNPLVTPEVKDSQYDDSRTQLVPLIPPPGSSRAISFPSGPNKGLNCYQTLIHQHGGERQEPLQQHGRQFAMHHQPVASQASATDIVSSGTLVARDTKQRPTKPCAYFNSARGCRNGANCTFLHKVCAYFNSARGCRNGANCVFPHDVNAMRKEQSKGSKRIKLDSRVNVW